MNSRTIFKGFIWQYLERFSVQAISFVVTIILARLLMPSEYGVVSLALVFTTIFEVFVTSGLGNALVQKKDVESVDFSSVLYFNIIFAFLIVGIVYLVAPSVGAYYKNPILTTIIQLLSIRIIIASFNSIQYAYVQRQLIFKRLFVSSTVGTAISAILGIWTAYIGWGAYALVVQYLSSAAINTIVLFFTIKWRPTWEFSYEKLLVHVRYGWKLLCSGLLNTVFAELKSIVIGTCYSPEQLAFYDKGKQFPSLFYNNINTSITQVLFPVLSQAQNDMGVIKKMTNTSLRVMSCVLCPILMLLAGMSDEIIEILMTEKWLPASPYLIITCFTFVIVIINTVLTTSINSIGRSDLHLKVETLNIVVGVVILLAVMKIGAIYIALSVTLSNLICATARIVIAKRLFDFKMADLYNSYLRSFIISVIMLLLILASKHFISNLYVSLISFPIIGCASYFILTYLFNRESLLLLRSYTHKIIHKHE